MDLDRIKRTYAPPVSEQEAAHSGVPGEPWYMPAVVQDVGELVAEIERWKLEISRQASGFEAIIADRERENARLREHLLAAIASRDEEIARLKAAYDKLLDTSEKAIYDCLQGR